MSKGMTISRIRSEMKKLNTDSYYVGTYDDLNSLKLAFPEWKGHGNKPPIGGKICDKNSWAYVGKDPNYDTFKFTDKGKWKKINNSSGTDDRYKGVYKSIEDLQKDFPKANLGDWALVYDDEDLIYGMWFFNDKTKAWEMVVDESSTYMKGVYLSWDSLQLKFPDGKHHDGLASGDMAILNVPSETGLDIFIWAEDRLKWVQSSSSNVCNMWDIKDGVFSKAYATINPKNGDLRMRRHLTNAEIYVERWDDESKIWENVAKIGSFSSNLFEVSVMNKEDTANIWDWCQDNRHNIWRRYITPTEVMNEYGSLDRNTCMSVKDHLILAKMGDSSNKFIHKSCVDDNWNIIKQKTLGKGKYEFIYTSANDGIGLELYECKMYVSTPYVKVRLQIFDINTDICIYDSSRDQSEFSTTKGKIPKDMATGSTTGLIKTKLAGSGYLAYNTSYKIKFTISEGELIGEKFPDIQLLGTTWGEEKITTEEWVQSQSFAKPQSLQQTLEVNNTMDANTNIKLSNVSKPEEFTVDHTEVSATGGATIELTRDGYNMKTLNLNTVTPQESSQLSILTNPKEPIKPYKFSYLVYDVPNAPIDLPDHIRFEVIESNGDKTIVPYKYTVDTTKTPFEGSLSISLDGRVINNVVLTFLKPSRGTPPDLSKWGYLYGYSIENESYTNLFEKIDERFVINEKLIKDNWIDVPDSSNIIPADNKKIITDSIYRLPEDVVSKVEALPIDQRLDVLKMKNVDTLQSGVFRGSLPNTLSGLTNAKRGDYWKNTTTAKITLSGIDFNVNDELYCMESISTVPTDLSKFQRVPFVSDRVNSNWLQTDSTQPDYIKNKPTDLVSDTTEATKTYARKNKQWLAIDNLPEVPDTKLYSRTKGGWAEATKQNLFDCADKWRYSKDEFMTYDKKMYRALRDTIKHPTETYQGKSEIIPTRQDYIATSADYCQIRMFSPFQTKCDTIVSGFRVNMMETPSTTGCFVALAERQYTGEDLHVKILAVEGFDMLTGENAYTLKTPWSVVKDKQYEIIVFITTKTPVKIGTHNGYYLEDSIVKIGLLQAGQYSMAHDAIKNDVVINPQIGESFHYHQGSNDDMVVCVTPIIETAMISDWIEVVGGKGGGITEVKWDDILDKPKDLLTDELLTSTPHDGIKLTEGGKGVCAKTGSKEQVNLLSVDVDTTYVGNPDTRLFLQSNELTSRHSQGLTEYMLQTDDSEVLPDKSCTTELVVQEIGTKFECIILTFKKVCTVRLTLNSTIVADNFQAVVGRNYIPITTEGLFRAGDKLELIIETDQDNSIAGMLLPTPKPYLLYSGYSYNDSPVVSEFGEHRRIGLGYNGSVVIKAKDDQEDLKLLTTDRDMVILGNISSRIGMMGVGEVATALVKDIQQLTTTDDGMSIKGRSFEFEIDNPFPDHIIRSATVYLNKRTRLDLSVNDEPIGENRKQFRQMGDNVLRPTRMMRELGKTLKISISTDVEDCLIGKLGSEEGVEPVVAPVPRIVFEMVKVETSSLVDKHTTRTIESYQRDNINIHCEITEDRILPDFTNIGFAYPTWATAPMVDISNPNYPEDGMVYFNGNYDLKDDTDIVKMTMYNIQSPRDKCRANVTFEISSQPWYEGKFTFNKDTFSMRSIFGYVLNPIYKVESIDEGNVLRYQTIIDYAKGDILEVSFGKGNQFTNAQLTTGIYETFETSKGYSENALFSDTGRLNTLVMPQDIPTTLYVDKNYGRNLFLNNNDNFIVWRDIIPKPSEFPVVKKTDLKWASFDCEGSVDVPAVKFINKIKTICFNRAQITNDNTITINFDRYAGVNMGVPKPVQLVFTIVGNDVPLSLVKESIKILDYQNISISNDIQVVQKDNVFVVTATVNKLTDPFKIKFFGNADLSNAYATLDINLNEHVVTDTSLFVDDKINPKLINSAWDMNLNLSKGQNIHITHGEGDSSPVSLKDINFKAREEVEMPTVNSHNGIESISFTNCVVASNSGLIITNILDDTFVGKPVTISQVFTKRGVDFKVDTTKIRVADGKAILKNVEISSVKKEDSTVINYKLQVTPKQLDLVYGIGNIFTNSECTLAYITGNASVDNMFIGEKINPIFYDKSGFDYKIDLTKSQNLDIIKQSPTTKYTSIATLPYRRQADWVSNQYIKFDTLTIQQSLVECTHFTIKGIDPPTNYTDTSVPYRLVVADINGTEVTTGCVACTGLAENRYNALKAPIPTDGEITLWVNPLQDPFSYLPSDRYEVEFFKSDGGIVSVPLINATSGLINNNMLPQITGDVYLSANLRIRGENNSFIFESNPTGTKWIVVGKMN